MRAMWLVVLFALIGVAGCSRNEEVKPPSGHVAPPPEDSGEDVKAVKGGGRIPKPPK